MTWFNTVMRGATKGTYTAGVLWPERAAIPRVEADEEEREERWPGSDGMEDENGWNLNATATLSMKCLLELKKLSNFQRLVGKYSSVA